MSTTVDFEKRFRELSEVELQSILTVKRKKYTPEAIEIATRILNECAGIDDANFELSQIASGEKALSAEPDSTILPASGFWSFGTMITLKIIPAAFVIALLANAIAAFTWSKGIYRIVYSFSPRDTDALFGWLAAIAVFIVSNLLLGIISRIFFEMLIVVFKIWENTKIIAEKSGWK